MSKELKERTKRFALDCWYMCEKLPKSREFNNYVRQLLRSSSSVGANYRAACRGKSSADFIYKLKIAEEETDESMFWLEILMEIIVEDQEIIRRLHSEANELLSIFVTSINTSKKNLVKQKF